MRTSATTLQAETTLAERSLLIDTLRQANLAGKHLEIGTAAGGTLKDMMLAYHAERRPQFVVVDPLTYFPDQRRSIEQNLRSANIEPASVDFRVEASLTASHRALGTSERFSVIFIDAVHDARHVTQDLLWTRLLSVGGLLAFHDYRCASFPGVTWAVDHFLRKWPNYIRIAQAGTMLIVRKVSAPRVPEIGVVDRLLAVAVDTPPRWRKSWRKRVGGASAGAFLR